MALQKDISGDQPGVEDQKLEFEVDFGDAVGEDESQIEEYDLTSSPNDFNVITIVDFIKSGAVKIPGFQRNYVWDIKRASKLIESILIGLPVPQVFLYEEARNSFLVIDGQQRLMTLFYFVHGRFPRRNRRSELRRILDEMAGSFLLNCWPTTNSLKNLPFVFQRLPRA